jgi:hypothetical protein
MRRGIVNLTSVGRLRPSPENDRIYRPIDPSDPNIRSLAESIVENGIMEPLTITSDFFIISGHRRLAAAKLAGVETVPCVIESITHDDPDFLRLLTECNRQRVKSNDEILREAVIQSNPEAAYESLIEHRKANSNMFEFRSAMEINGFKTRCKISSAKLPFLHAVYDVLEDFRVAGYLPVSLRAIHYKLLNNPPLIHASKPRSVYKNDLNSYGKLSDLLTRARLEGTIRFEWIIDETRPSQSWNFCRSSAEFIRQEVDGFLKDYWRDLMQSQPNYIEVVCEKLTLKSVINGVCAKFCVPYLIGRGYASIQPRWEMVQRFYRSGKEKLIVIFLSDHDPDGEEISQSFARSVRDDFSIDAIPIRAALTEEQVAQYDLPPGVAAKQSSSNFQKFSDAYGSVAHELEALPPETLAEILTETIDSVIDADAFNREVDREKEDAGFLESRRRAMLEFAANGGLGQ